MARKFFGKSNVKTMKLVRWNGLIFHTSDYVYMNELIKIREVIQMTREQYMKSLAEAWAEGRISAEAYDSGLINMEAFDLDEDEEDKDGE